MVPVGATGHARGVLNGGWSWCYDFGSPGEQAAPARAAQRARNRGHKVVWRRSLRGRPFPRLVSRGPIEGNQALPYGRGSDGFRRHMSRGPIEAGDVQRLDVVEASATLSSWCGSHVGGEGVHQTAGDGTDSAGSDRARVDAGNGRHFGARSG